MWTTMLRCLGKFNKALIPFGAELDSDHSFWLPPYGSPIATTICSPSLARWVANATEILLSTSIRTIARGTGVPDMARHATAFSRN